MSKIVKGYETYLVYGPQVFSPTLKRSVTNQLTPGIYSVHKTQQGDLIFDGLSVTTDTLIRDEDGVSADIIKDINKFWSDETKQRFAKFGVVHKRGILMHGKPGGGKTATVLTIAQEVVDNGGVVFFNVHPELIAESAQAIREIQPTVNILCIFEEFDTTVLRNAGDMLSLLDGELQVPNICFLATTNYIDRIEPRFKSRPSRFARVVEVGVPTARFRRKYIEAKLKGLVSQEEIDNLVEKTEGFVLDQIKDCIIGVYCMDVPLQECLDKLTDMDDFSEADDLVENKGAEKRLAKRAIKQIEDMYGITSVSFDGDDDDHSGM